MARLPKCCESSDWPEHHALIFDHIITPVRQRAPPRRNGREQDRPDLEPYDVGLDRALATVCRGIGAAVHQGAVDPHTVIVRPTAVTTIRFHSPTGRSRWPRGSPAITRCPPRTANGATSDAPSAAGTSVCQP